MCCEAAPQPVAPGTWLFAALCITSARSGGPQCPTGLARMRPSPAIHPKPPPWPTAPCCVLRARLNREPPGWLLIRHHLKARSLGDFAHLLLSLLIPPVFLSVRRPAASAAPFLPGFVEGFILQIASLLILIVQLELPRLDVHNACRRCLLPALGGALRWGCRGRQTLLGLGKVMGDLGGLVRNPVSFRKYIR